MMLKICGITNQPDCDAAIAGGATAIGFNFYPPSPRCLAPEDAASIGTPPEVLRVGVFVNEERARIDEIARIASLHIAQLHGDEASGDYPVSVPVWKAVRLGNPAEFRFEYFRRFDLDPAQALMLDGPASGVTFPWQLASVSLLRTFSHRQYRIIIAGGLDASNVAEAIATINPWGVDACSRLEASPGIKDHKKMTEFLSAAKAALSS